MDTRSEVEGTWQRLGGRVETPPRSNYLKLTHDRSADNRACVAVDLNADGSFKYFANVRMTTTTLWDSVYSEVVEHFERWHASEHGSSHDRVECAPLPGTHPEAIRRYLELTVDFWSDKKENEGT